GHDRRVPVAGLDRGPPLVEGDGLPGVAPAEITHRNLRRPGADVRAEGEERVEALEELDVPGLALGDRELREAGVRIDERLARDGAVLVAPEPRPAREVQEQVRVGAPATDLVLAAAVVAAVVVHEAPAVAEAEGLERAVD